jgi:hypothetical protein
MSVTDPEFVFGMAVTGGVRYWGSEFAETKLFGSYIFAEYIKGSIHVSAHCCIVHCVRCVRIKSSSEVARLKHRRSIVSQRC